MDQPHHFSVVVVDVEGSGSLSGPEKKQARADLYAMLGNALRRSGIEPGQIQREDRGDGVFYLVDAGVSKRSLFDPFLPSVDDALRARPVGDVRLRLRMVVHHGEVLLDPYGSSGPALDEAFAMLDAAEVKAALAEAASGRMAVVVPDDLYRGVVEGYDVPDPDAFRKRHLDTKRGRITTWVTVTGARHQPGSGYREPEAKPRTDEAPAMNVNNIGTNTGVAVGTNTGAFSIDQRVMGRRAD